MEVVVIFSWIIVSFIIGYLGDGKEIGFGKSLFISLILSPLIGAIFVATSPKATPKIVPSQEAQNYIISGDKKLASGDIDGALSDYEKVLTYGTKNPNTQFKMSCIFSLRKDSVKSFYHLGRAVEDGFIDYQRISTLKELSFLREQSEFKEFVQNGYKSIEIKINHDTISQLERLALLKEKGVVTQKEFDEQKQKILAG